MPPSSKSSFTNYSRGLCSESNSGVKPSVSGAIPQDRIIDALPQEPLRLVRLATRQPYIECNYLGIAYILWTLLIVPFLCTSKFA